LPLVTPLPFIMHTARFYISEASNGSCSLEIAVQYYPSNVAHLLSGHYGAAKATSQPCFLTCSSALKIAVQRPAMRSTVSRNARTCSFENQMHIGCAERIPHTQPCRRTARGLDDVRYCRYVETLTATSRPPHLDIKARGKYII